ncbi:MAG: LacI family DNA-binding transcriptional regulator [Oscillospiraceae bacterium]|nr:LacI family DNA-binding transcriptional regulator [Oscillospiraceae bacterium]
MLVTVFDVAKEAGVSIATVSRVMNNSPRVSPATVAAVRAAVEKLGYVPNQQARSLRKNESNTILVMIPDVTKLSYSRTLAGISEKALEYGYTLLMNNAEGAEQERVLHKMADSQRVDGAIILNVMLDDRWLPEIDAKLPLALCTEYVEECACLSVGVDDYQVAFEAVSYLMSLGHRRIGYLGSSVSCSSAAERLKGYRDALARENLEPAEIFVDYANMSRNYREGCRAARELLNRPDRPEALFCYGDILAMAVVTVAGEMGIRVPEELAVMGVDNTIYGEMVHPYLTTVSQPFEEIGRKAMELIHRKISGEQISSERIILPHHLKLRESTIPADK